MHVGKQNYCEILKHGCIAKYQDDDYSPYNHDVFGVDIVFHCLQQYSLTVHV